MLTNVSNKNEIINRLVQLGIDYYPISLQNEDAWIASGNFGLGKKWPILFAGIMLNDTNMKNPPRIVGAGKFQNLSKFSEDGYTYYGAPTTNYPLGKPMFGADECLYDSSKQINCGCTKSDGCNCMCRDPDGLLDPEVKWGAYGGGYRYGASQASVGQALAIRIMNQSTGSLDLWNNSAFFDYIDRWIAEPTSWPTYPNNQEIYGYGGNTYGSNGYMTHMWNTYRNYTSPPQAQCIISKAYWQTP
jgi:hypothetical protein